MLADSSSPLACEFLKVKQRTKKKKNHTGEWRMQAVKKNYKQLFSILTFFIRSLFIKTKYNNITGFCNLCQIFGNNTYGYESRWRKGFWSSYVVSRFYDFKLIHITIMLCRYSYLGLNILICRTPTKPTSSTTTIAIKTRMA